MIGCEPGEDPYLSWEVYKGDPTSSSYSALDQINRENVDRLEVAWIYRTDDFEDYFPNVGIETNPIVVRDVLYGASPYIKVFAVDAATGEELWMFDPFENERAVDKQRGVVYWEDGNDRRILFSAGTWLYALHAETGEPVTGFGNDGRVDLREGLGRDPAAISVMASSPGIIHEDLLILGSHVPSTFDDITPGHIRAYDVRTGEMAWIFHTLPEPGEPGFETWENMDEEALNRRSGANNWVGMSLDQQRGIVYVPTAAPMYDWYGGNRPGKNLFANSLLALDAATGEYIWHYQVVHHDLWNYDLPAPPNLLTVERNGRRIDAVVQITKQGFTFVFNRETGESLFPIEHRPVPPSYIESEQAWPTQPFPVKPEPYARQHFTADEVTDLSPEARDHVLAELEPFRNEGLFTPPDPDGTVYMPGTSGAGRWGGAAHDPGSGILYLNASEVITIKFVEPPERDVDVGPAAEETLVEKGETYYVRHCAACHGLDRRGQPPEFPALHDLRETSSPEEVLDIVERGGGMMPAFPTISEEEKRALIAYLFDHEQNTQEPESAEDARGDSGEGSGFPTVSRQFIWDPDGYPPMKPPWGTLNAIDVNTGDYKWRVPLGTYPELEEKGIPPTGMPSMGGPIVTAGGLLFIAGTEDKKFRAFDSETGEMLWETTLPAAGFATPATYVSGGKQFVVIAAGGGRGTEPGDYYVAFSLPD